jgi:hypothetical protein
MAKEIAIALSFTSKGEQKVIKNLQDLETELSQLQGELKTLDFGSDGFKNAVKNINLLKSQIKDVDKATEGLESAQRIQAIGEAVGIAAASFQILTGIIGLFISNTEDLEKVQRFEATALSVLNTTLGITTLLYQKAELGAKGYSISTAASAAATELAATATKIWNAVLKANPIALVATAVIALTATIYGLIQAFSESNIIAAETKRIQGELTAESIKSATALKEQLTTLTDSVSTRELELEALDGLRATYPGLNAFIDKNNKLTKEGIEFIKTEIALEELRANRKLLTQRIQENQINSLEAFNKELDFQNGLLGKTINFLAGLSTGVGQNVIEINSLANATEDFARTDQILNDQLGKTNLQIEELLTTQKPYRVELKKTEKAEKEAAENASKTTEVIDAQTQAIERRIQILQLLQQRLKVAQSGELNFLTDVLQKQNEILDKQNDLLSERRSELDLTSKAVDDLVSLFFTKIPGEQDLKNSSDALFDFFNVIRIGLSQGSLKPGGLGFNELLDFFAKVEPDAENLVKILQSIPDETKTSFIELFNSYDERVKSISTLIKNQNRDITTFVKGGETELLKLLIDVEKQQSDLFESRVEDGLTENQILLRGRELVADRLGIATKIEEINRQALLLNFQIGVSDEAQQKILRERLEALGQERASLESIVDVILEGVVKNNKFVESINNAEKAYRKTETQIQKNKKAIEDTFNPQELERYFATYGQGVEDVLKVFVLDTEAFLQRFGEEGTKAILRGVVAGIKEQGNLTRQEVERTIDIFEKAAVAIKLAFGGTGQIFTDQIEYLRSLLRGLPNELTPLQEGFQNIAEVAQKIIAAFSDLSNRLSQVIQANNSLLLEQLARDEAASLAAIGDTTARARELREQEEKKYAKRRFDIEKRARIQELNFATANAIADSAGAIINALATIPPPASIIYASLLTALTGAQLQVIANQRTSVQAQQFVGRRGGLISGGSHEQGGVPALLEGGEFIVNREAVSRFGDQISDLNSATGGRRLSIDDSRLVQAISSQNMTSSPLKAYVLYNDIQSTEKLNKKITQLARL